MPASLSRQLELLTTLGRSVKSGLALDRALELSASPKDPPAVAAGLASLRDEVRGGRPLVEQAPQLEAVLGTTGAAVVAAGERAGKLEESLKAAAAHVEDQITLRRTMALALAYPALVGLAALVLMPVPTLVSKGIGAAILGYYLPAFVILGGLFFGIRALLHKAAAPGGDAWEARLDKVPLVGGFLEARRATRFFATLAAILDAGLGPTAAFDSACRAAGSARLESARAQGCRDLDAGTPLSKMLPHPGPLGTEDIRQVAIGEESGALPGACRAVAERRRGDLSTKGTQLAIAVGALAVLAVGVAVVWHVISFWMGYFTRIGEAGV